MTSPRPEPRHRARFAIVVFGVPALLGLVALVLALVWLPELPDPVAVHWGTDGVNGYGPAWVTILLIPVLGIGLPALLGLIALTSAGTRLPPVSARWTGAFVPALSTFLVVLATGTLAVQRGLSDAHDAGGIGGVALVGGVAAVAVGVIAWFALPADPLPAPDAATGASAGAAGSAGSSSPAIRLGPGERAAWTAVTSSPPLVVWLIIAVALVPVVVFLIVPEAWSAMIVTAVILVIALCLLSWRVTVDARGLHVRALLGVPVFHVALDEIAAVRTVQVDPLAEFGGWGIRLGTGGRLGIVTRRGPGIEVERTNGRRLVVTAPDAATGAALLTGLRDAARA
ncbi:DUF1648 domain-containing protein [Compostimonas suwonensis]|uniref:Uncharacterized protein DUF1648 n=1 Tax=Compostimonas suwonensis TaxID=1048394 RepID=A0A2M9C0K5_9MICO|nr:DUF1648 domain-containing protein [Compostimonas suwonensis]PJJ63887.1 uncharacterized protein DUF1648 [Compostimonas suwonensis]